MSRAATRAPGGPCLPVGRGHLGVGRAQLVVGIGQPFVQPLDPPVHHLDLAAQHVDLPADTGHGLGQRAGSGGHLLGRLPDLGRGGPGVLVQLGRERAEPRLGAALDRRHLLVQLRRALGELGHGLVQAAEPAGRRLHALLELAHAVLQPGQLLVLRPHGRQGLADGVAHRLQLG